MSSSTTATSAYHVINHNLMAGGVAVGLTGFVLLLTGAVAPPIGAGVAFTGINVAYFAGWNLICETTCMSD